MLDKTHLLHAFFEGEGEGVGDVGREVDFIGDALLCVLREAVGVVLDGEQKAQHKEHQGDT